jgi:glycosyltransferase involved in cell wall biosynthesis
MFKHASPGAIPRLFPSLAESSRPNVLYTGSLKPEKGAGFLVHAAPFFPDINFVIIGGSPVESRQLGNARSLPPNLFIHPSLPYRDIPSLLAGADILAMPYQSSGKLIRYMSPLKMFEYLASGKPIISADLPVLRPVLEHGRNAFLFEPDNVQAFGSTLRSIISLSQAQKLSLQEAQLQTASEHSWDARATDILNWYTNNKE